MISLREQLRENEEKRTMAYNTTPSTPCCNTPDAAPTTKIGRAVLLDLLSRLGYLVDINGQLRVDYNPHQGPWRLYGQEETMNVPVTVQEFNHLRRHTNQLAERVKALEGPAEDPQLNSSLARAEIKRRLRRKAAAQQTPQAVSVTE